MSNMKVRIKERNDADFSAVVIVENARLGYFADPAKLTNFPYKGKDNWRYDGQFHLDKDAEGAQEFIDLLFDFKARQSTKTDSATLRIKDGDDYLKSEKGADLSKSNANTWIIPAYRQAGQELGKLISKKAYQEGDEVPAGFSVHFPAGRRAFIAKNLTSSDEIGGNCIAHMVISIYKVKDVRGVFISWESMQLVKFIAKNNRGSVEDFADLPDTEDEAQADNEVEKIF